MAKKPKKTKLTFREKLERVYGRGSDERVPSNPLIEVDRHFTRIFSEKETTDLSNEQSRVRERLAAGLRR